MYGRCVRQTGLDLFGRTHSYLLYVLPTGMDWLEEATQGHLGAALDIVRHRTVAGAYWPYLSLEARRQLADCCRLSSSMVGPLSAGGFGPSMKLADHSLRFCECCLRDELQEAGVGSWDIVKQLPGSWVCTRHQQPLHILQSNTIAWRLPDKATSRPVEIKTDEALGTLNRLARVIASTRRIDRICFAGLVGACLARLMERGVLFGRSRGRELELQKWFDASALGHWMAHTSSVGALPSGRWINGLLTNRRASHPLKWALLWTALTDGNSDESAVREFFEAADDSDHCPAHVQLSLWPAMRLPEAAALDDRKIHAALEQYTSLTDAAEHLGMSVHALARWMTHDSALLRRWRGNASRRRTKVALEAALSFFAKRPTSGWSAFIAAHPNHVFWLKARAPALFHRLLASRELSPTPQMSIFDDPLAPVADESSISVRFIEREALLDS